MLDTIFKIMCFSDVLMGTHTHIIPGHDFNPAVTPAL